MNTSVVDQAILQATQSRDVIKKEVIQELWSGYGQIIRCWLSGGIQPTVIVKHIQPPHLSTHPRGWNTDRSHQRKIKSYQVESEWYAGLSDRCNQMCRIPELYYCGKDEDAILIIMEDLDQAGYTERKTNVSIQETKICLTWLASFHAMYLDIRPEGLWPIGTYWHLETRPDEQNVMTNKKLKASAAEIDHQLNTAKYQTIVHGDAKLANFCFAADAKSVAAVDFQYVGGGVGIKDVAYFISSCFDEQECQQYEEQLLDHYFEQLTGFLAEHGKTAVIQELIAEWRSLYPYAWADFYRFLDGWSPGHWKMHDYSLKMVNDVLHSLEGKLL